MNQKKVLILRACGSIDEKEECENITSLCRLYAFMVDDYCPLIVINNLMGF